MAKSAREIIDEMIAADRFSKWLGIEVTEVTEDSVLTKMTVREEMVNGFGISHGGISYSFADSTFAFISNGEGMQAVSIETSISHLKMIKVGDVLHAEATKISRSRKIGVYEVKITNQLNEIVAVFKGTVYISDKKW
ncbi:hydroxyphenylacetyl-CoA thioesterase PaaI [Saprospiraceae bacterium]|nr:hydroxyphenylacetyl-CoA thioesterase PaaI [Saprospiraceae bacterium]